jgi:hypothetical protein
VLHYQYVRLKLILLQFANVGFLLEMARDLADIGLRQRESPFITDSGYCCTFAGS